MADSKIKEKERAAQLKALREELETQIEADLEVARNLNLEAALRPTPLPVSEEKKDRDASPKRILEALLFASAKPMTINEIQKILMIPLTPTLSPKGRGQGEGRKELECLALELKEEYDREGRSFELIEIAGGYEIVTRKEYAMWLARLELQRKARQASHSALETLAILAYKQPVTRAEIEELRGVDVSAVLSTLLERSFIKITGKKEVAGRPFLYGTTEKFLEHFGLKSLADLPPIGEIKSLVERAVRREELDEPQGTQAEN